MDWNIFAFYWFVNRVYIKINIIKNAPKPVGNYPHSVEINGILYLSGVGPRNGVR